VVVLVACIQLLLTHPREDDSEAGTLHSSAECSSRRERQQNRYTAPAGKPSRQANTSNSSDIVSAWNTIQINTNK